MDIANKIKNFFGASQKTANSNTIGISGNEFLKRGNRNIMPDVTSKVAMSDMEFYKGWSYAALNNRANKVAQLAIESLKTDAAKKMQDAARAKEEEIIHPYLKLIDESDDFTVTQFWYDISTYLDLEGVYYLMAVRTVAPNLVGTVQSFKMLNPYDVRRVIDQETMEVGGYIETRNGLVREIPPEMIIPIRKLNPFSRDTNFAMTDAAKDSQFTLNQAGDFTRSSLKNNLGAPGIISTDVLMDRENFQNFQARVISNEKGMPLFGNGTGAINWDPMQIDMDKAALMDITSISRDQLFAVAGVSKTTMGQEESGTTRDVARTQKEKFVEDHIMPQVQMIIDALNQDYKKYYKKEYETNKFKIIIDNPLGTDKDTEGKEIENNTKRLDLYNALVGFGYEPEIAARYAQGEINLEELGEPTLEPELTEEEINAIAAADLKEEAPVKEESDEEEADEEVQNSFLAINRGAVGNPYRDSKGRFGTGPAGKRSSRKMAKRGSNEKKIADAKKRLAADAKKKASTKSSPTKGDSQVEGAEEVAEVATKANKKLEKASSGSAVNKQVEIIRKATSDYIEKNGGDPKLFKSIDENWVGNDYKILENHVKNGDSKELTLVQKLQQAYFKANGIKEVTVYRGVYNKQAKQIKAAIKAGKKVSISSDYASSWTGYDSVAADYADGAAFTAPDKITDSVVIKMTFPVKDILYSTQVAPFYAGNTNDEFIVSTPKGYSIGSGDIEVIK